MNTKDVKVTMKDSKDRMIEALTSFKPMVEGHDEKLTEVIQNTLNNADKATKSDIYAVLQDVYSFIESSTGNFEQPLLDGFSDEGENKKQDNKPVKKPKTKKPEVTPTENEVKKPVKKPVAKKASPESKKEDKKPEVKTVKQLGSLPVAKIFPAEVEVQNLGKLKVIPDTYNTMDDIAKALEDGKRFYFLTYWTARHIKEYDYAVVNRVNPVKSFPNDLDILEPVYFCENIKRIWCNSVYTEAMYSFETPDLEHIEDTDPYNGDKFRVRVSNGMEFEIYELAEDSTEPDVENSED